jgi:hypothetical protein
VALAIHVRSLECTVSSSCCLYPCRSFNSSEEQLLIAGKLLQLAAADERERQKQRGCSFSSSILSTSFAVGSCFENVTGALPEMLQVPSSGDSSGAFSPFGGPHYENRGTNMTEEVG